MHVSGSIYQACKLYEMFSGTDVAGKCAIVRSYSPTPGDIKGEASGEGLTEKLYQYDVYRRMLADFFETTEEAAMYRFDEFERSVKHSGEGDRVDTRALLRARAASGFVRVSRRVGPGRGRSRPCAGRSRKPGRRSLGRG